MCSSGRILTVMLYVACELWFSVLFLIAHAHIFACELPKFATALLYVATQLIFEQLCWEYVHLKIRYYIYIYS